MTFESGGEEGTIGWSAAPTLVERQRENLTERLKREFGLFLSDDEEERARKHGTHRFESYNSAIFQKYIGNGINFYFAMFKKMITMS